MEPVARAAPPRLRTGPGKTVRRPERSSFTVSRSPRLCSRLHPANAPLSLQCPPWTLKRFLLGGLSADSVILPLPWVWASPGSAISPPRDSAQTGLGQAPEVSAFNRPPRGSGGSRGISGERLH